jgi:hypothetical protein
MSYLYLIVYLLWISAITHAQGYHLEPGQMAVAGVDWQSWETTPGTVQISAEGIQPQFIRDRTNAALDAPSFGGGIWKAGTRQEQAAQLIDGREDTYWEPDPSAPLEDWSVEIDLGRLVWAQQVVVKFVVEDGENPVLEFKVRTSSSSKLPSPQRVVLGYNIAGRSQEVSNGRGIFAFGLRPTELADPGFSGDMIRFVQLIFTNRDEGQTQEISEGQWLALPAAERGVILYFRRLASGVLQPVDQTVYEAIADLQHRGPIKYYRRSRVRLAEVEVWTGGDNLSLGAIARGGRIGGDSEGPKTSQHDVDFAALPLIADGNYASYWSTPIGADPANPDQLVDRYWFFDLGALYRVNRIIMAFSYAGIINAALPNYTLSFSDGSLTAEGRLNYTRVASREGKGGRESSVLFQDHAFAPVAGRYLRLDYRLIEGLAWATGGAFLGELQLYGAGFLPRVTLTSGPIELGSTPRTLSTIRWEAEAPPGTRLEIRTRTGDHLLPKIRYFSKTGSEVTQEQYRKLLSFLRGDSLVTRVPGPDWSNWSEVYPASGATITSPSPRRYAMIEATLLSDDPDQAVLLRRLRLGLKTILASQVVGEVSPAKVAHNGQREEFTLYVRPLFQAGDQGFDQVVVSLPPEAEAEVMEVRVGSEEELKVGGGKRYGAEALQRVASGPDSLWLRLPERMFPGQVLVALRFSAVLYQASTPFVTSVGLDTGGETTWQRVDGGEATALGEGQGLTVFTPFAPEFLGAVEVSPNPFTPNGDGINDQVNFTVPVYKVLGDKVLVLEVFSLDGRRVRRVARWASPAVGLHHLTWDGRDQEGVLVPLGLYLCRVGMAVDAQTVDPPLVTRLVASVY